MLKLIRSSDQSEKVNSPGSCRMTLRLHRSQLSLIPSRFVLATTSTHLEMGFYNTFFLEFDAYY